MNKIIGIDFGEARIGLSISDLSKMMAFPLKCIKAGKKLEETTLILLKEVENERFDEFVIGLPLLMSGKDSPMTTKVRNFAVDLESKSGKKVHLWDERLTSKEVENLMMQGSVKRKKRAALSDTLAATLILQNFLDAKSFQTQL